MEVHEAEELAAMVRSDSDDRMPRLEALLELVAGAVPLLIEIKSRPDYDVERTCASVAALLEDYAGDHAVMSFDSRAGQWLAANSPQTPRGLVCTDASDLDFAGHWREAGAMERAQPDFLAVDIRDLPGAIFQLWRDSGRPLISWTVRNPDQRRVGKIHADTLVCEGEGFE
jgi:glycerophosphoryl diester phosphodiesterase